MPLTQTYISDVALWTAARKSAPAAGTLFIGLSTSSTVTPASSIIDFLATEVTGNGYARQPLTYTADGSFNTTTNRHELPQLLPQFTASGGSIVWRTAFALYGARVESRVQIPAANVNITTNVFTTTAAHGLAVGESIMFTDGGSSGLPAPLAVQTIYVVQSVPTTTTFTVATVAAPSTAIDITTAPGGPYNLHYAKGSVQSYVIRPSNETITNGSSGRIVYDFVGLQGTYV